ncbi:MAG: hypothetical protein PVI09_18025 [Anaerolineae bacterium]
MSVTISFDRPMPELWLDPRFRQFTRSAINPDPDLQITAHYGQMPDLASLTGQQLFDAGGAWTVHSNDGDLAITVPGSGDQPYRVAMLQPDLKSGHVYTRATGNGDLLFDPLMFPLTEVLMICLLSEYGGLMVHACGVDDGGKGYLFAGKSTHGKSTMAGLWQDSAQILSDERIVIRRHDGQFWIYGTPWHGDLDLFSPHSVPLEKFFILEHGSENRAVQAQPGLGLSELLTRSYLPFWDAGWMGQTLGFARDMVAHTPPKTLAFVPNQEIVEFVRAS